jgi:hypothetical protein
MSSKKQFYRQCRIVQVPPGSEKDTVWIPEKLAKVGKLIYLGEKRPPPLSELYRVTNVYERRSAGWLCFKKSADKHQRRASDV